MLKKFAIFTTWNLQTDVSMNVIGEFQSSHNWILNCTLICKINVVKLIVPMKLKINYLELNSECTYK